MSNDDSQHGNAEKLDLSPDQKAVHVLSKQILKTRLFIGEYLERRYVDKLETYRDIITVCNNELEFKHDLEAVYLRVLKAYGADKIWIGITCPLSVVPTTTHCMWVELSDMPFGKYWFQVTNVRFRNNELLLKVKEVRPIVPNKPNFQISIKSIPVGSRIEHDVNPESEITDWHKYFEGVKTACSANMLYFFSHILTLKNTGEAITFLFVLLCTAISGGFKAIIFLGNFTIQLLRETSLFVQAATPIFLGVIDFFSKMFGGFYILIAMMWRGKNTNSYNDNTYNAIQNRTKYRPALRDSPRRNYH